MSKNFIQFSPVKVTSPTKRCLLKMCHLKHRLPILLFRRKVMLHSQDNQVFTIFYNPMIYQICNVMMRDRVRF